MRLGRVVERLDERMTFQRRLHDPALHALPAAVNQPHFQKSSFVRRMDVFLDDGTHVARCECV